MKLAVVGSRGIREIALAPHIPTGTEEIISGGAVGVDACAAAYARENGLRLTEILPQYERYGRAAPIIRNRAIVEQADAVLVFWDGRSKGTQSVIAYAKKLGKPITVIPCGTGI